MASLNMTLQHCLSQKEALARVKRLLGELKTIHADKISNLQEKWDGNVGSFSFTAMSFSISGTITVNASTIELAGKLPFAASLFQGKIKKIIRERAQTLLTG